MPSRPACAFSSSTGVPTATYRLACSIADRRPAAAAMSCCAAVTRPLGALSWLPVTASLLPLITAPSATPVIVRLPALLFFTSSVAPAFSAPKRTAPVGATCITSP
ncbi:hypothetical protein G6F40_016526 [Rhizopus arrhizus]|nr:hypothetical protein G6F40_016526 [Rhizopus arrhizus]